MDLSDEPTMRLELTTFSLPNKHSKHHNYLQDYLSDYFRFFQNFSEFDHLEITIILKNKISLWCIVS